MATAKAVHNQFIELYKNDKSAFDKQIEIYLCNQLEEQCLKRIYDELLKKI